MKLKKTLTWAAVLAMAVTPAAAYTAVAEETPAAGEYLEGGYIGVGNFLCKEGVDDSGNQWLKIGISSKYTQSVTEAVIPSYVKYAKNGKEYTSPVTCIGATNMIEDADLPVDFSSCVNLKSVTVPDTVKMLGINAFNRCESLTSIKLPKDMYAMTSVNPFAECTKLASVEVDPQNERLYSKDGVLFGKDPFDGKEILISYLCGKTDKTYVIPDSVEGLSWWAFNNSSITTLYVPKITNEAIVSEGFYKCPNLTDIYFEGTEEEWNSVTHYNEDDTTVLKDVTVHFNAKPTDADPDWTPDGTPKITKFSDEETGIEVTAASGVLPEGVTFNAKLLDSTADSSKYDLSFTDAAGNEVQPNGKVTVSIPLPAGWETAYAYRVEGSTKTLLPSEIKNGKVVFTTDHFSVYMLTAEEDDPASEPTESKPAEVDPGDTDPADGSGSGGNTGTDQKPTGISLVIAPAVLAAGAAVVLLKKRK